MVGVQRARTGCIAACLIAASACAVIDENEDESLAAVEVALTGPPGTWQSTLVPRRSWWSYYDGGEEPAPSWRTGVCCWPVGYGPFGYGESYPRTVISYGPDPANKYPTAYFARSFLVDPARVRALHLRVMYDDGFVFYLNGREGGRASMPEGPVSFSTLASSHEAENRYQIFDISAQIPALASSTVNTFAFEVHQASPASSDLVFDAELIAWMDGPAPVTSYGGIPSTSTWHYWDRGGDLRTSWRMPGYADAGWSAGPGPLGFGEDYVVTTIASGPITTYLRKQFVIDEPVATLRGDVMYDDGFVVYLNGSEIGRASMPSGSIHASTLALGREAGGAYRSFDWSAALPLVVRGENTLAVEVHQASSTSSDLVFDLALHAERGWHRQASGTDEHLSGVWFLDRLHGWAVGSGVLLHTSDGGATWTRQSTPTPRVGLKIYFVDAQHGWILGGDGLMMRTTDGGATWRLYWSGVYSTLMDVWFADPLNGWMATIRDGASHANDGGFLWMPHQAATGGVHYAVGFVDFHRGWIAGTTIAHTTDGGATWAPQWFGSSNGALYAIEALSPTSAVAVGWEDIYVASGNEQKLLTRDGGATWQVIAPTRNDVGLEDADFIDASRGWAVGYNGSIIHTSDGGATWTVQEPAREWKQTLRDVHFVDGEVGWAVGDSGTIWKTTTGGR